MLCLNPKHVNLLKGRKSSRSWFLAGHTTLTCPHRIATEHGVVAALRKHSMGLVDFVHERQLRHHLPPVCIHLSAALCIIFVMTLTVFCCCILHNQCVHFHLCMNVIAW